MGNIKILLILLSIVISNVSGGRVLFIALDSTPQRLNVYVPIIKELLYQGHNVTAITTEGLYLEYESYNEIIVGRPSSSNGGGSASHDISFFKSTNECHASKRSLSCVVYYLLDLLNIWSHGREMARAALNSSELRKFIDENSDQFDVVISDFFATEAMYTFAYVNDAPLVLITSNDDNFPIYTASGAYSIWSNIKLLHGPYDRDSCFLERLINRVSLYILTRIRNFIHLRKSTEIIKEYFKDYSSLPSVGRIEREAAMVLFNNFDVLNEKIKLPGVLDIGGINIFPVKPLPQKLQEFLDKAENGAIYINLGPISSNLYLPREKMNTFLNAFKKLRMRVIWKFDNKKIDLPKNVMTRKTLPQNSILEHSNVKVFITHGGQMSLQEGVLHMKPMIVIPSYPDQVQNGLKVEQANIGLTLLMDEITPEYLVKSIRNLMSNSTYQKNLEELTKVYHNSQLSALDRTIFWIEHVMTYKNSRFIQPVEKHVSWYEYIFLDSLLTTIFCIYGIFCLYKKLRAFLTMEVKTPKSTKQPSVKTKRKQTPAKQE